MTASSEGRTSGRAAGLVGVVTTAAVGLAMWRSPVPWTLGLDAGVSFLGQTVPAFRTWAAGRIPEWTDLLWGGFPLLAEPTTAALYPPHVLAYVATFDAPLRFFDVALALHVGLLAAGSTLLVRELGAGLPAAVVAGLLAVLSPIGHGNAAANFAGFAALAWLPWILVAAERLVRPSTPSLGGAMVLGWVALAAQVLVGMPEHAVYAGVVAVVWIACRRSALGAAARIGRIALLGLGALATSAPQVFATLAYLPATIRSGAAPAAELASLWIARPLGLLVPGTMSAVTALLGGAALALAAVALAARRPGAFILIGVAAVTFVLALGPQAGLYSWFHRIPPFGYFRAPVKLYGLSEFAVVWTAALGVDVLVRNASARLVAAGVALAALAVLERVGFVVLDEQPVLARMYHGAPLPGIVEMLRSATVLSAHAPGQPPPLVYDMGPLISSGYAGSLGALVGMSSLHAGGVALLPRPQSELLYGPVAKPALTLFGVAYALVPTDRCPHATARLRWPLVTSTADFCVLRNPDPVAPFAALPHASAVESVDAMIAAVRSTPAGPVPVVAPPELTSDLTPGWVVAQAYRPGDVRLSTRSAGRTLLLVRQSFVPGWRASVDGQPATLYPAAALYFALPVDAGVHTVTLTYRAPGLRAGFGITAAWWLAAAVIIARRRSRLATAPADVSPAS